MSKVWSDRLQTCRKPLWCLSVSVLLKPTNELDIRQIWCHSLSHRYWWIHQIYTFDYFTLFILWVDYILGWCFHECLPVLSDLRVKEVAVVGKQNHTELNCPAALPVAWAFFVSFHFLCFNSHMFFSVFSSKLPVVQITDASPLEGRCISVHV